MPRQGASREERIAETKAKLQSRFGQTVMPAEVQVLKREIDNLNPRISLNLGVTLPMEGYRSVRADAGLTIDRPDDMTADETFDWLGGVLMEKITDAIEVLMNSRLVK